jgi:methylenetetrahydrofolate reductase (NADPH)
MFFDNKYYFNYVDQCRSTGITVPLIPGLKILTSKSHLNSIPKNFRVTLPDELADEIFKSKPEHVVEIGVEWAAKQVEELLSRNVSSVHFYIMQDSKPISLLMKRLKLF